MNSRVPIVRQVSWTALVSFTFYLGFFIFVGMLVFPTGGALFGIFIFYLILSCVRSFIPRHHRAAVRFATQKQFERAIPEYENSIRFFEHNSWLDRYRSIVMFSLSLISYREMDLLGIAFSMGRLAMECVRERPTSSVWMNFRIVKWQHMQFGCWILCEN
jgi:hypothetical protein